MFRASRWGSFSGEPDIRHLMRALTVNTAARVNHPDAGYAVDTTAKGQGGGNDDSRAGADQWC